MQSFELPDPRGVRNQIPADPAPRLASLDGARVVFVNNAKMTAKYHGLQAIPQAIFDAFPGIVWEVFLRDLLRYHHNQIPALADEICALNPVAAVLALADAGVSVQTMLVAAELEARGIPTVVLATSLGGPACRAIAEPRVPALPIVMLDAVRWNSPAEIVEMVAGVRGQIETALTRDPPKAADAAAAGVLSFAPKREGWGAAHEFQDWLEGQGLGDGLPLLPPVPEAVAALLATVSADPDEVLYGPALTSGRSLRVRDAAVNAAMTGCPARAFPVVVAALRAAAKPDFRLLQAAITTHPSGYFVLLTGCDPARFGMSGGAGCLGPGHRGNLSVGRAVSLSVQHLFGARPGAADLTSLGSPAEIAYCMAEDHAAPGWASIAGERGFDGPAVMVMKAEGPKNVLEHVSVTPKALVEALSAGALSISANNAYVPCDLAVVLTPEHHRIFIDAGWSRSDLAHALHQAARHPRAAVEGRGADPFRPAYMDGLDEIPVTRTPSEIHIVAAGAPGPHSMVALPWGYSRAQWAAVEAR